MTLPNDDLSASARKILAARFDGLPPVIPTTKGWSDAVGQIENTIAYVPPSGNTAHAYVHRRLGPISVNPNVADSRESLIGTYEHASDNPSAPNASDEDIEALLCDLISQANKERDYADNPTLFDKTDRRMAAVGEAVTALYGRRGCGKTFLLNYILARYAELLDEKKVIWIRINLVEDFGDNNLVHWIHAQCAKVIMRYYDPNSKVERLTPRPIPVQVEPIVVSYINAESDIMSQKDLRDDFRVMKERFYRKGQEPPLDPSWIPKSLVEHLFNMVQHLGYSFIVALDGLDLLEATPHHNAKFESLVEQLGTIAVNPTSMGMALVAVMRTRSLEALATVTPKAYAPLKASARRVGVPSFDSILRKRVNFLSNHVPEIVESFDDPAYAASTDWGHALDQFVDRLNERSGAAKLLDMFGQNRRAQGQVVQLAYHEHLERHLQRPYLLIESMVKAGRSYPPRSYHYSIGEDGGLKRSATSSLLFDNHFFPSVFTFPYVDYREETENPVRPHEDGYLLGLRILQLLYAHSRRMNRSRRIEPLKLGEMTQLCEELFSYPEELVVNLIEEYQECEFLELLPLGSGPPTALARLQLVQMPKTPYLLRHFLPDIAYLSLAAMRVPISTLAASRQPPYFEACTLDLVGGGDLLAAGVFDKLLARWVAVKIINACELIRLVCPINEKQRQSFPANSRALRSRLKETALVAATDLGGDIPAMFDFTDWASRKILSQVGRIEATFVDIERVKEHLARHARHWLP